MFAGDDPPGAVDPVGDGVDTLEGADGTEGADDADVAEPEDPACAPVLAELADRDAHPAALPVTTTRAAVVAPIQPRVVRVAGLDVGLDPNGFMKVRRGAPPIGCTPRRRICSGGLRRRRKPSS